MEMFQTILIILLILFIFILIASVDLAFYVTKPKRFSLNKCMDIEKSKNFWGNYDQFPIEKWNVTCPDGYVLHGELSVNNPQKFVIITHGYTYTRYGSVKYANIFYPLGYSVYLYDLRHHGENQSCYCSMGQNEPNDVITIAKALRDRFGEDIEIGLHGESLGCATSLLALGLSQNFKFLIADCGFSSLKELLIYQSHVRFHIPKFLVYTANWANFLMHRYLFFSIKPIDALSHNQVPICFMHGKADNFIPPSMSEDMYQANSSYQELYLFDNANHAESYQVNPERYTHIVEEFLKKMN